VCDTNLTTEAEKHAGPPVVKQNLGAAENFKTLVVRPLR